MATKTEEWTKADTRAGAAMYCTGIYYPEIMEYKRDLSSTCEKWHLHEEISSSSNTQQHTTTLPNLVPVT
jgi:hypothetical protein